MEEWKQDKLIDLLDSLIDYRGKTPRKVDKGIPLITAKIVKNGRIDTPTEFLDIEDYDNWMVRGFPKNGDVILTTEAPLGEVAQLDDNKIALAQRIVCLRGKEGVLDNTFLKYFLLSSLGQARLKARETGTTVTGIKQSELKEVLIDYPPYKYQKQITSILKSLDDKIELNRHINENLEQQAQALFKSWFIDFEPFKDGKFVDSELGMIPEGWKVIETNKFMTISKESINPSKNPNCFYAHYSIPAFDEKSMPIFQYGNEIKSNKQKVSDNMTLVSKLNPRIKRIWFIDKACENAICSTEFIPYISLNNSPYFLYCYLDSDVFYNSIMSSVNGATGSHQRFQANDTLKFLFPYNEEVIYKFNLVVSGILKHKSRLIIESQKLSQLRNTLLPRLMSGELEIKDNSYD